MRKTLQGFNSTLDETEGLVIWNIGQWNSSKQSSKKKKKNFKEID